MTAILEIPEVRQRVSRLSVAEYHRLEEFNQNGKRTELIRGIVFEKMSKSPLHATIVTRLFKILAASFAAGGYGPPGAAADAGMIPSRSQTLP